MKLAYPVAEPAYNGNVKGMKGSYDANFAWLKSHGYTGIELLIENPDTVDTAALDTALKKYELSIAAIGTSPMQIGEKLFLLHPDEENKTEARRRCSGLLKLCAKYRVPALIGKYRGILSDDPGCSWKDLFLMIQEVCNEAKEMNVPVLIEPQNAAQINNLNTIEETLAWIDQIGYNQLGLLADIYHMSITETSLVDSIQKAADKIGFIHMSDSGRKIPGEGGLPISEIIKKLQEVHYQGFLSLEIDQLPDEKTAAARSAEFLQHLIGG